MSIDTNTLGKNYRIIITTHSMTRKTKAAMSKTKKKTEKKPFATKAPKGKVRVHFIIGVSDRGLVEVNQPSDNETLDSACEDATPYNSHGQITEFHHVFVDVPVPKSKPVKAKKVKAKKVKTKTAEPDSDDAAAE